MALTNDQITAQNFKDFYEQIRPYLNGQVPTFANQFSRSDLYSTSEKIIGCWTDGKPVYSRTFQGTFSSLSTVVTDSINSTNNELIYAFGNLYNSVGAAYHIGYSDGSANSRYSGFILVPAGLRIDATGSAANGWVGQSFVVTAYYTKKSDSAIKVGTGTDYSTEEQVIGTWIDGKPLYQKTISTNISQFSGSGSIRYYDVSSLSIDKPFGIVSGMANVNGTWYSCPDIELSGTGFNSSYSFSMTLRNSATNGFVLWMQDTVASRISDVIFTIRYTKTTD